MNENPKPTVYLVRHETTTLNDGPNKRLRGQQNIPLDSKGRAALPGLANFFTGHHIAHVVTADLDRHMETGLAIARKHHTTFTPTASLRPWGNTGSWGHRELNKALYKEMGYYIDHPNQRLPNPNDEQFGSFAQRHGSGMNAIFDYTIAHPEEPVAAVISTRGMGLTMLQISGDKSHIAGHDLVGPGGVVKLTYNGNRWEPSVIRRGLNPTEKRA